MNRNNMKASCFKETISQEIKGINLPLLVLLLFMVLECQAHETVTNRIISTNGIGIVEVKPDQVAINLTAKALHKTAKLAKDDVENQVNNLIVQLDKIGVQKKDIIASTLRLNPRYEHRSNEGRYFAGYEAQRSINITLHNLKRLPSVLDEAIENGINTIDSLNFESSKEDTFLEKARQLAIEDSKQKAATLAKAYGAELGAIHNIDYHTARPLLTASFAKDMPEMAMLRTSASPATYLPDTLTFQDNIQVTFDLIINH